MTTILSNKVVTCVYCGKQQTNTKESMLVHVINCDKRPELGLLVKLQIQEDAGDILLKTIHSVVKALAEIEGMRTKSWEIYHTAKKEWEEAKQSVVEDLAEEARESLKESENEQEEEEENS